MALPRPFAITIGLASLVLVCAGLAWCASRFSISYRSGLALRVLTPQDELWLIAHVGDAGRLDAILVDHPEFVDSKDAIGRALIHWAAENPCDDCIRVLIRHGSDLNVRTGPYSEKQNATPETALHIALRQSSWSSARLLLESGASADIPDGRGVTARALIANAPEDVRRGLGQFMTPGPSIVPDSSVSVPSAVRIVSMGESLVLYVLTVQDREAVLIFQHPHSRFADLAPNSGDKQSRWIRASWTIHADQRQSLADCVANAGVWRWSSSENDIADGSNWFITARFNSELREIAVRNEKHSEMSDLETCLSAWVEAAKLNVLAFGAIDRDAVFKAASDALPAVRANWP